MPPDPYVNAIILMFFLPLQQFKLKVLPVHPQLLYMLNRVQQNGTEHNNVVMIFFKTNIKYSFRNIYLAYKKFQFF